MELDSDKMAFVWAIGRLGELATSGAIAGGRFQLGPPGRVLYESMKQQDFQPAPGHVRQCLVAAELVLEDDADDIVRLLFPAW